MLLLLQSDRKRALETLFSDGPVTLPNFEHGETKPLTVGLIESIASPLTSRLFEPQDLTGWSFRAALGNGFLPPVAGVWFILSGINLTAGLLTVGKRYKIVTFVALDVFTNVGAASNATGVVFTATGTTPTTWTHASILQECTTSLGYAPTYAQIQTALDATAWIVSAGGVTVSGSSGFFYFTFTTAGSRSQMTGDTTNLAPLSLADFSTLIDGTTTLAEVQAVRLLQNPGAYCTLTIANTAAGAGVTLIQTGGAGLNAKYRLSFATRTSGLLLAGGTYKIVAYAAGDNFTNVGGTNATNAVFVASGTTPTTWTNGSSLSRMPAEAFVPYDGQFSILVRGLESAMLAFDAAASDVQTAIENINRTSGTLVTGAKYKIVQYGTGDVFTNIGAGSNTTGVVFVASGTTPTTWTNGSVVSPVGAGNVNVAREAQGQYLITFQGDMANTAMATISSDGSALKVIPTLAGNLDLRTAAIDIMLAGETSLAVVFEIEGTPPGGTLQKLYREDVTLVDSIIDPSSTTPPTNADGNIYIGAYGRLHPIVGGFMIQTSADGIVWDDQTSWP